MGDYEIFSWCSVYMDSEGEVIILAFSALEFEEMIKLIGFID